MKKKLFTLFTLALLSIGNAWGLDSGTENSGNQGSNNTTVSGKSYTLDGKYVAGKGGVQQGNMPDKGVKLRSNQGDLVFEVVDGYKITKFEFWGCGNTATAVTITSATVDDGSNLLNSDVVLPGKGESTSGDISISDISATDNITLTFASGSTAQIVGTWKITYEQTEVVLQEITNVALNGSAISDDDLATLKSSKAVTIDGSSLNGVGLVEVTLSSGSTKVTKSFDGTSAIYKFTINSSDEYTITVTNVAGKTYTQQGSVIAYKGGSTDAEGQNTNTISLNGITFKMDGNDEKTFQYGSGKVTISSTEYQPIKLSTGSAVKVTFPDGKVATKVIVYGWSASGNGKLAAMKETNDADAKSVDVSSDVYYACNTADDIYPSVYEYELDNWGSLFFNPGGSPSQPFVVMDFVLADAPITITPACAMTTYVTTKALDFTNVDGLTAYVATGATNSAVQVAAVTAPVPAGTPLVLVGTADTEYTVPVAASATAPEANMLVAGDGTTEFTGETYDYILASDGKFYQISGGTVAVGKAYLHLDSAPGVRSLVVKLDNEASGIESVDSETADAEAIYNVSGQRVAKAVKGLYIVNGKKVIIK